MKPLNLTTVALLALLGLFTATQATNIASGGTLPTGCRVGDLFIKTGTGAGLYACVTVNAWSATSGSGGGDVSAAATITDHAIVRGDGGVKGVQESLITIDDAGALALPDGVKQTFNPNGTNAGFNVGSHSGDPSSLANGDCWYQSTANEYRCRINGATVALGAGGGGGAPTGATYITQTADGTLSAEQALASLSTGVMKVTTSTGVVSSLSDFLDYQFVRKTSDESVSNTTFQDDDDLNLSVGANDVWQFDILLFVTNAANTADIKVTFTLPASGTASYVGTGYDPSGTTQQTNRHIARHRSVSTFGIGVLASGTEAASHVRLSGLYVGGGTAGTVQLQWAQQSSDGSNATVVKADSYFKAFRVQ